MTETGRAPESTVHRPVTVARLATALDLAPATCLHALLVLRAIDEGAEEEADTLQARIKRMMRIPGLLDNKVSDDMAHKVAEWLGVTLTISDESAPAPRPATDRSTPEPAPAPTHQRPAMVFRPLRSRKAP